MVYSKTEYLGAGACGIGAGGAIEVYPSEAAGAVVATGCGSASSTMLGMNPLSTVYATKRRRRNGKR